MGAKVSAEMKYALHLVRRGKATVYEAAIKAKLYPSSIYKAMRKQGKDKKQDNT